MPLVLLDGYRRFRQERFAGESERYRTLAREQRPRTMVIGCADSRVDPATIFSAAPGELFVVRNVAALVPPFEDNGTYHGTSAALEFAVSVLGVESIVVLGHGLCGGIAAALSVAENRPVGRFIRPWVDLIADIRNEVVAELGDATAEIRQNALEHLAVRQSLQNLESFPFIAAGIERRTVALHGAWFSIAHGELHWLERSSATFEPVQI